MSDHLYRESINEIMDRPNSGLLDFGYLEGYACMSSHLYHTKFDDEGQSSEAVLTVLGEVLERENHRRESGEEEAGETGILSIDDPAFIVGATVGVLEAIRQAREARSSEA